MIVVGVGNDINKQQQETVVLSHKWVTETNKRPGLVVAASLLTAVIVQTILTTSHRDKQYK